MTHSVSGQSGRAPYTPAQIPHWPVDACVARSKIRHIRETTGSQAIEQLAGIAALQAIAITSPLPAVKSEILTPRQGSHRAPASERNSHEPRPISRARHAQRRWSSGDPMLDRPDSLRGILDQNLLASTIRSL